MVERLQHEIRLSQTISTLRMNRQLFGKLARNKRLYATNLDYRKIPKASANKRDKFPKSHEPIITIRTRFKSKLTDQDL